MLNGLVLVNKSQYLTSNALLQRVKRLFNVKKAGHTGSLDPLATGMLPICLGEATKISQFLLDADKCYLVTGQLGLTTDTGDALGKPLHQVKELCVSKAQMQEAVCAFTGAIQQIPPMFSALKHHGKPLYHFARQGVEIERKARGIMIYQSEIISFNGHEFCLRVLCSKGTYIRSLVMDIGEYLGVGAHVTALHRCYTAGLANESMWSFEQLAEKSEQERLSCLLPMDRAILNLPMLHLSQEEALYLHQGRVLTKKLPIEFEGCVRLYQHLQNAAVNSTSDRSYTEGPMIEFKFIGIGNYNYLGNTLKAQRLLAQM